ncbi:Protein phosphatase 2C [Cynara cardunculus var. scolymus]|uniref:Protein phosphatase 2C n=1 Tax=Cynara cardunculus var. scolymus TaxID=59895 RepID=A0A118K0M1_CYNCS|nr:Protein phosphatase 2C [Cynara cardunculus var. scolymus]
MEKRYPVATGGILHKIKKAACLDASSSDTGKGKSKSSNNKVSHGFHLVEGQSGHDMEDYHVAEYRTIKGHELGLFAIFDGHLGDCVPSYLKDNLFNNILGEPNFWENPEKAIKNAYRSTDKFILENSGDVPRVNGQLAVARAFGDQSLKAHLSSEPDTRHVPIDSTIELVILASDGLWKVMANHEAIEMVKSIKDPLAAAKRLTTEALARKSKDDISCIVIRFG